MWERWKNIEELQLILSEISEDASLCMPASLLSVDSVIKSLSLK